MTPGELRVCPSCGFLLAFEPARVEASSSVSDSDEDSPRPKWDETAPDPVLMALAASPEREDASENFQEAIQIESVDSNQGFALIDLDASQKTASAANEPSPSSLAAIEDEPSRPGLAFTLLVSYASAATFALFWFVALPRLRGDRSRSGEVVSTEAPADPGVRALRSRIVTPSAPVAETHRTVLGRPLVVGAVEFTPLEVARRPVALVRNRLAGGQERREEPNPPMFLRFRIKNVSNDLVFAPFDETFVRERNDGITDSFVETDEGGRIYPYPLAVESEWTIDGQSFTELRPGESDETRFVVATDDGHPVCSRLFWRLRLRTGIGKTEVVGVQTDVPPE